MAVPTVYRWDDVNAPVITDVHDWTQIKDWFDKIFVTGYLENDNVTMKPALGWSVTVDDAAFTITLDMLGDPLIENLARVRFFFNRQVNSGSFACGRSMKEHQDTNPIVTGRSAQDYIQILGQNDDDLKVCPWVIIGTSRGFWQICGQNKTINAPTKPTQITDEENYISYSYWGNYINDGVDLGKNNQCAMQGEITVNMTSLVHMSTYQQYRYSGNNYGVNTCRDFQNNIVTANDDLVHYEGFIHNQNRLGVPSQGLKYPYIDGGLYIKPFQMYHRLDHVYYGRMAGMYYPEHIKPLYSAPSKLIEFTGTGVYAGQEFIGISSIVNTSNEFYINISEDWDI